MNEEDQQRLAAHGLVASEKLQHPCPHFIAPACSIYRIRPFRCSDYTCRVLEGMLQGELEPGAAHGLVEQALAMRKLVQDALPGDVTADRLARDLLSESAENRAPARLLALARFAAFRIFVERHFLGPKSRWMTRKSA
ncbi:hypothetical protein GCM10011515_11230 [Tsuneonella deserti]|uniref:Flagellin N-methylase n=1 Tax=Tsuneonella deserti TaxID=2035528 RepID=A0ABQ1S466_9SPHN|nr:hypothetical protein GCM10011515_11230 [Tsuneonella deserti]